MPNENSSSLGPRLHGKLYQLVEFLFFLFVALSCFRPLMDNVDIGWHIAQGRWMVEHGAFYRQEIFNYPNLGHGVIDEYPLFQIVLYLFWSLGWWGPCLFALLVYGGMFRLLLKSGPACDLRKSARLTLAVGLMLLFLQVAFTLRPHMVTYLGVVWFGVFLLRHREASSWMAFWPMALLQIAWVNSHSGFILGPALVGLFGAEIVLRRWLSERRLPWGTLRTWAGALALVVLACFVNPYGVSRLYLPFYHENLESIRAYVGEMEPLNGIFSTLYKGQALLALLVVAVSIGLRRGAVSYSFLLLAILFYLEALSARRHWAMFGLFVPLLVLSTGAFAKPSRHSSAWLGAGGHFAVLVALAMAVIMRFDGTSPTSLFVLWNDYNLGRNQLAQEAAAWMKAQGLEGRLFHRCEDGGWLQQDGYDRGETFADTGFGKYEPAFIHEVGLVGDRPALLSHYLKAYHPAYVICANFCYDWPYYLRREGWRPIFYSANSSAWAQAGTRPDLPTVPSEEIARIFSEDMTAHGRPSDLLLYGRDLLALNSLGLEDFTFNQMKTLPAELHRAPWYWEAARLLCFETPGFSGEHRLALFQEAKELGDDSLTAEFRAYALHAAGDTDGALHILESIPPKQLGNKSAELLLKIYLDRQRPEALALARRMDCFDLRNGFHWQYLAEAEEQAGNRDGAARAWKKAVFYYPDDARLMKEAASFAAQFHDTELSRLLAESTRVYGEK